MRTARLLIPLALLLPSIAGAQVMVPAPPGVGVYFQGGIQWRWHRRVAPPVYIPAPAPVYAQPAPPPVYYPPPPPAYYPPPPPVYYAPPPPAYYAPPPPPAYYAPPAPPPSYPAPAIVRAAPPKPDWKSRFGLGATVEGLSIFTGNESDGFGVLGQLRYRATRHLVLDLQGGYERSTDPDSRVRTDYPLTFGLMIPFLGPDRILTPYVVFAGGFNFSDLTLFDAPSHTISDTRTQAIGQAGGGLELRLGQHFAINADVRAEGRWNLSGPSDAVAATTAINGKPVTPLADSVGLRFGLGGTVYF